MRYNELTFQGRNAVLEAFRSGKTIDKLFILDGCQDGPIKSIVREAKKTDAIINYVDKERLDRLMNMQRLRIYLQQLRKREKIHLYSFLMR